MRSAMSNQFYEAYVDTGIESSIEITLSGTPGNVTVITLPDSAKGFKLYPRTNAVRFAVNATPAAVATSATTPIAASAFAAGGVAKADAWEVRLLPPGTSRTLSFRSITASVVNDLEIF